MSIKESNFGLTVKRPFFTASLACLSDLWTNCVSQSPFLEKFIKGFIRMLCVLRDVRCEVWLVIEFQHKGWLSRENTYFGALHKITKNLRFLIIMIFLDHRLNLLATCVDSIAASLFVLNWLSWQIVRRLRQPPQEGVQDLRGATAHWKLEVADVFWWISPPVYM